jgi:hypothetical protein
MATSLPEGVEGGAFEEIDISEPLSEQERKQISAKIRQNHASTTQ